MGAHIPYCQKKGGNFIEPKDCENCEHYHSKYKKTNADRIRAMTDEELSDFLGRQRYYPVWCDDNCQTTCRDCCLKWLKEEVKENAN